jgi:hypothetical protein
MYNIITTVNPVTIVLEDKNSLSKVRYREKILQAEEQLKQKIEDGELKDVLPDCTLTHTFSPIDEAYGCCSYARQIFLPKGTAIIGKIHRHEHLNIIISGKVSVVTDAGKKYFEAPLVFVSDLGTKRAVYAEEDTIWVTIHLTKHRGEENMDKIEAEVIAPTFKDLGLISSMSELMSIEDKGEVV